MDGLKIVPQLFYDLIARVIPGAIAIFALTSAIKGNARETIPKLFKIIPESVLTSVMMVLVAGYVIGHLTVPLSDYLKKRMSDIDFRSSFHLLETKITANKSNRLNVGADLIVLLVALLSWGSPSTSLKQWMSDRWIFRPEFKPLKPEASDSDIKQLREVTDFLKKDTQDRAGIGLVGIENLDKHDNRFIETIFLWYDWLRIHKPEVGDRLTKLRAEHEMHKAIAVVLISAFVVHCAILGIQGSDRLDTSLLIVTFTGFLFSALGMAKTYWRFQLSTINHYFIVNKMPDSLTRANAAR